MAVGIKTGGRQKGSLNKATREVKALASAYGPEALKELARLSKKATSEAARVAACREILDRAYGKATQSFTGSLDIDVSNLSDAKLEQLEAILTEAAAGE